MFYSILTMITVGHINTVNYIEQGFSIFIDIGLSGVFAYSINMIGIIFQEINKSNRELRFNF